MNINEIIDNLKSASDTDLANIFNACLTEQRTRENEKIEQAINKFREAYGALRALDIDVYVNGNLVYNWDDFSF